MRKAIQRILVLSVPAMATIALAVAKIAAVMPCHGQLCEPKMHKSLMR